MSSECSQEKEKESSSTYKSSDIVEDEFMILFGRDLDAFLHSKNLPYYDLEKELKRNRDFTTSYFSSLTNLYTWSTSSADYALVKRIHNQFHVSGDRL